jgi:hypothetical protein
VKIILQASRYEKRSTLRLTFLEHPPLRWKILKACWQWIDTTARENSMQLALLSPTQRMMNDLLGTNKKSVITERFHLAKNASTRSKLSPKFRRPRPMRKWFPGTSTNVREQSSRLPGRAGRGRVSRRRRGRHSGKAMEPALGRWQANWSLCCSRKAAARAVFSRIMNSLPKARPTGRRASWLPANWATSASV